MQEAVIYTLQAIDTCVGSDKKQFTNPIHIDGSTLYVGGPSSGYPIIKHVKMIKKPQSNPLSIPPWAEECETVYLSIEPALEEIFYSNFNNMPWWKRAYVAIRYGITL